MPRLPRLPQEVEEKLANLKWRQRITVDRGAARHRLARLQAVLVKKMEGRLALGSANVARGGLLRHGGGSRTPLAGSNAPIITPPVQPTAHYRPGL